VRRGDLVSVTAPGDYGKPRPAVIVQADLFNDTHASIVVCLLTTDVQDAPLFRIDIDPGPDNGLKERSQIMVDKIVALRRERIADRIGRVDDDTLVRVNRGLALFLGLAQ
jgi:mRNA interferase MazF